MKYNKIINNDIVEKVLSKGVRDMPQNPAAQGYSERQIRSFYYIPEKEILNLLKQIEDGVCEELNSLNEKNTDLSTRISNIFQFVNYLPTASVETVGKIYFLRKDNNDFEKWFTVTVENGEIKEYRWKNLLPPVDSSLSLESSNPVENKAVALKFASIEEAMKAIEERRFVVAETLPESDGSHAGKIYLVPSDITAISNDKQNIYDEYIEVETDDGYAWEKIGDTELSIEVDDALSPDSTNPVQNKVLSAMIGHLGTTDLRHDSAINTRRYEFDTYIKYPPHIVDTLPDSDSIDTVEPGLYLVPKSHSEYDDWCEIYITSLDVSSNPSNSTFVWRKIGEGRKKDILKEPEIDAELNLVSTNPVQNKVIADKFALIEETMKALDQHRFVVVSELPEPSGSYAGKIYLVPSEITTVGDNKQNIYDEYIEVENSGRYVWEKIGSLSKEEVNGNIVVDAELNKTSTNPVQNKAIAQQIEAITNEFSGNLSSVQYNLGQINDRVTVLEQNSGSASSEGVYELIETIETIEETPEIKKETEPDGTPYNFKAVYVRIHANEAGTASNVLCQVFSDRLAMSQASFNKASADKWAYSETYQYFGWWANVYSTWGYQTTQTPLRGPAYTLRHSLSQYPNLTKVLITNCPPNSTVEIWGVRNHENDN